MVEKNVRLKMGKSGGVGEKVARKWCEWVGSVVSAESVICGERQLPCLAQNILIGSDYTPYCTDSVQIVYSNVTFVK